MKDWIRENYVNVIVALMYLVEIPTCLLVLMETVTGISTVDRIWDLMSHLRRRSAESSGSSDLEPQKQKKEL